MSRVNESMYKSMHGACAWICKYSMETFVFQRLFVNVPVYVRMILLMYILYM